MPRPLLLAVALALTAAPARAQAVKAEDIINDPGQNGQNQAQSGQADPMQQRLQQAMSAPQGPPRTVKVEAGAEQGLDAPIAITIPTSAGGIRIETVQPGSQQPAEPAGPPPRNYTPIGIMIMCVLFGVSVWMKKKQEEKSAAAPAQPVAGSTLGQTPFRIVKAIGEGGMGVVYEAVDTNLDRRVAVKRMRDALKHDSAEDKESLLKEAKTVAALHHPNIVDIHALVDQGGETYMVFEFIQGKTLDELLKERQRLSVMEVKAILDPVCRALEFAHGQGIIHRDLKLANVMVTTQGVVKVMDFGIARHIQMMDMGAGGGPAGGSYALTNTLVGTPLYQSPEGEMGMIRPEVDVYALGVMFYKLLSGSYPFPAPVNLEMKLSKTYKPLSQLVAGLSRQADGLVDDSLEPSVEKRLSSPRYFRERLAALPG